MKEIEAYDREWLIANKFPHLAGQIRNGDFKILNLVTTDGFRVATIVRFPNLTLFRPELGLFNRITSEILADYPYKNIHHEAYGLIGLDIVGRI